MTRRLGLLAIAVTVAAWAAFALSVRAASRSPLTGADVAVLRYVTPALLLLPWWRRAWREVSRSDRRACAVIAIGAGVPFLLLTVLGARMSSASHVAVINPGAAAVIVAALAGGRGDSASRASRLALAAIAAGIATLAAATPGYRSGVLVLLASATLWAAYIMAQQRARLTPITAALVISAPSAVVALGLCLLQPTGLTTAPPRELALLAVFQGIGAGIVSTTSYTIAIDLLGAATATVLGALTPVAVAALSRLLFAEPLPPAAYAGIALVVTGIAAQVRQPQPTSPSTAARGEQHRRDARGSTPAT